MINVDFKDMAAIVKIGIIILILTGGLGIYFLLDYLIAPRYEITPGVQNTSDIFVAGEDGYACYRIPAILTLPDDTILAFCEARKDSCSDHGNIDLVMKRSVDGGESWSNMQVIWDAGPLAVQNPMPVYDESIGTIFLGVVKNRTDTYLFNSTNNGTSWNGPRLLSSVKPEGWDFFGVSPGHGIILASGRILFAGMNRKDEHKKIPSHDWQAHVIYSDDHGETWERGYMFDEEFNECLAVQLENGSVMMILRKNRGLSNPNYVYTSISNDGGVTFDEPKANFNLISPICQSSIVRFTKNDTYMKNRLLFSNPASLERDKMTIKLSYDEGETWEVEKLLYEGPTAYSDLSVMKDKMVCCLFENGRRSRYEKITFVQFDLDWITQGQDDLMKK